MKTLLKTCLVTLLLLLTSNSFAAEQIIFEGLPLKKSLSFSNERTEDVGITKSGKDEFKLVITRKDNKYYWKSRNNVPLDHFTRGQFHYFVNPTNGYIKVTKGKSGKFVYIEHLANSFKVMTYWGTANSLNL